MPKEKTKKDCAICNVSVDCEHFIEFNYVSLKGHGRNYNTALCVFALDQSLRFPYSNLAQEH